MTPIQPGAKTDLRAFWGFLPIEGQGFRRIETDGSQDGGGVRLPGRLPDELVKKSCQGETRAFCEVGVFLRSPKQIKPRREKAFQHLASLQPAAIEARTRNPGLRITEEDRPGSKNVGLHWRPGLQIG